MCTVTAFTTATGIILTSSRDEITSRPTAPPQEYRSDQLELIYPADILAGGTWVAMEKNGAMRCLLNGAHDRHERRLPYRKSRGLVVTESFAYASAADFINHYDATCIEPFTLIWVTPGQFERVDVVRWNETQFIHTVEDLTEPRMWQSATLYSAEIQQLRRTWFQSWLHAHRDKEDFHIQGFHHLKGSGDTTHDIRMLRGELQTVSITQIRSDAQQLQMHYKDLITNTDYDSRFRMRTVISSN
jgi:hypothetical protein